MSNNISTKEIVGLSVALIALGGLGIALAYKRAQRRRQKAKNLSIQIV